MRKISIHLQEGFEGDTVILSAYGRILAEKDFVTTRSTIPFATTLDVQVDDNDRALTVVVAGLSRRQEATIDIGAEPFLGLNLTKAGQIVVARSNEAFCYM